MKTLLVLLFLGLTHCNAQERTNMDLFRETGAEIINEKVVVTKNRTFDNPKGLILGPDAFFDIEKGVTLKFSTKLTMLQDHLLFSGNGNVRFENGSVEAINVKWFGSESSSLSATAGIQKAIDVAIKSTGVSLV